MTTENFNNCTFSCNIHVSAHLKFFDSYFYKIILQHILLKSIKNIYNPIPYTACIYMCKQNNTSNYQEKMKRNVNQNLLRMPHLSLTFVCPESMYAISNFTILNCRLIFIFCNICVMILKYLHQQK